MPEPLFPVSARAMVRVAQLGRELPVVVQHRSDIVATSKLDPACRTQRGSKVRRDDRDRVGGQLVIHGSAPVVVRTSTVAGGGVVASHSPKKLIA